MPIPLIKPTPPPVDVWGKYLQKSYSTNQFCNFGPAVQEFQVRLKLLLNLKKTPVVCCNATLALETVLLAAGLTDCDVLVPSFTFAATALAVERVGSRPIFTDSNDTTWHMCLDSAEKRLTKKTKAMIVVHPLGMVVDPLPFVEFAEQHKLKLIFDSAAAFGAVYPRFGTDKCGEPIGPKGQFYPDNTGLCEIYSFHITKSLGIGEGAAIVSSDADFLERCRKTSNFGLNENAEVELLGTNAKMSDFQAAVGLGVLEKFHDVLATRRAIALGYLDKLKNCYEVDFQCAESEVEQHTFPFFPIKYEGNIAKLKDTLKTYDIGFRQYYKPLHLHPRYVEKKRNKAKHFPVCNELAEQILCLPCHSSMSYDEIDKIATLIKEIESV